MKKFPEEPSRLRDLPRTEGTDSSAAIPEPPEDKKPQELQEDTDGRGLYEAASKYAPHHREVQVQEAWYIGLLLLGTLALLCAVGLGVLESALRYVSMPSDVVGPAKRFALLGLGGLLGGTVYGAKWLYHAVARGLWHEDRRIWRLLSPWISVGTTVGIWSLMDSGFFPNVNVTPPRSSATLVGVGFVIGYLSDRFLAKMKDLTNVLFGQTERHFRKSPHDKDDV